jgi:hypothetical protein
VAIRVAYVEAFCEGGCNACNRGNLKVWKINMGSDMNSNLLSVRLCDKCWNELKNQVKRSSIP